MTHAQEWIYWLFKRQYGNDVAMQYFLLVAYSGREPIPVDYVPPF